VGEIWIIFQEQRYKLQSLKKVLNTNWETKDWEKN